MEKTFPEVRPGKRNNICDVGGVTVGTAQDETVRTGVTVVVPDSAATMACAVLGGAPGTRETDTLKPENLVEKGDAVVLSGGSAFGLEAASALAAVMAAEGRGFPTGAPLPVPIVPAAILFDLANGGDKDWDDIPPYGELARRAYAGRRDDVAQGNVGAGYGAMAGQVKGGQGSASAELDGMKVGALVAANPVGAVVDEQGRFFAQSLALHHDGKIEFGVAGAAGQIGGRHPLADTKLAGLAAMQNTSIGVVAVEVELSVAEARRVALMAHDGLARAIRPIHTPFDGDSLFVMATGRHPLAANAEMRPAALAVLGALAADCVSRAVACAVWHADTLGDMISYRARFQ